MVFKAVSEGVHYCKASFDGIYLFHIIPCCILVHIFNKGVPMSYEREGKKGKKIKTTEIILFQCKQGHVKIKDWQPECMNQIDLNMEWKLADWSVR